MKLMILLYMYLPIYIILSLKCLLCVLPVVNVKTAHDKALAAALPTVKIY